MLSIILRTLSQSPTSRRHDYSSSSDTSRYLLDPHSLSATHFRRAVTKHEGALAVGEGSDDPRMLSGLAAQPLDGVVGVDAPLVLHRAPRVGQRLGDTLPHAFGGLLEPHPSSSPVTSLAMPASRDSCACTALSTTAALRRLDFGTFASALR